MTATDILMALDEKFPGRVKAKNAEALDPYAVIDPVDLRAVCLFLRDDPRLRFDLLNCVSGVDYLEPDPKKAPKAGFEPHLEVVYHMQSFAHRHRFVLKVNLPRWKDDKPGQLPEVPTVTGVWAAA